MKHRSFDTLDMTALDEAQGGVSLQALGMHDVRASHDGAERHFDFASWGPNGLHAPLQGDLVGAGSHPTAVLPPAAGPRVDTFAADPNDDFAPAPQPDFVTTHDAPDHLGTPPSDDHVEGTIFDHGAIGHEITPAPIDLAHVEGTPVAPITPIAPAPIAPIAPPVDALTVSSITPPPEGVAAGFCVLPPPPPPPPVVVECAVTPPEPVYTPPTYDVYSGGGGGC